jgi:hypothetical protein
MDDQDDDEEATDPRKTSYTDYQCRDFNRPHPDPLAESSSLTAIQSPKPADEFIAAALAFDDVLSGPQMEVVALALAKHEESAMMSIGGVSSLVMGPALARAGEGISPLPYFIS